MHDVIVPTPETCALRFWVARALAVNRHCLLVGKSGVGKSQVFKVSG
jgi:MoxR-like ATPase